MQEEVRDPRAMRGRNRKENEPLIRPGMKPRNAAGHGVEEEMSEYVR